MEDAQIAAVSRDLQLATVEAASLRSAITNLERSAGEFSLGSEHRIPAEFRDDVTRHLNEYRKSRAERVAAESAKNKAELLLKNATAQAATTSVVAQVAVDFTTPKRNSVGPFQNALEAESAIEEKKRELARLVDERTTLAQITAANTQRVRELSREVDELCDLDWELFRMRSEVGIKESQLHSVKDEIASIRRILSRKNALLKQLDSAADISTDVALLAHHKASEHRKLLQHKDMSVRGKSAAHHGAVTVKLHEEKLHLIGSAVLDVLQSLIPLDEVPEECDATEVDEIRRDIQRAENEEEKVQLGVDYFDGQVRNLEARIEILTHAIDVRQRDLSNDETAREKRCNAIAAAARAQADSAQQLLDRRKMSVAQLKSYVQRQQR